MKPLLKPRIKRLLFRRIAPYFEGLPSAYRSIRRLTSQTVFSAHTLRSVFPIKALSVLCLLTGAGLSHAIETGVLPAQSNATAKNSDKASTNKPVTNKPSTYKNANDAKDTKIGSVYIYRSKAGDTPNSIANDFLAKARWKSIREQFFKDNHWSDKDQAQPLAANLPVTIPVTWMFAKAVKAKLTNVSGSVTLGYANDNTLSQASAITAQAQGKLLDEGAVIKTGDNSFVKLLLPDNSVLSIDPNSEVKIALLRQYANSDIFSIQTVLNKGRVNAKVTPIKHPKGDFVVHSPRLSTGVRGTNFNVADGPNQNAITEVGEGAVDLLDQSKQAKKIPGGFGRFVDTTLASDLIPLLPAPLWHCDGTVRLVDAALPVVMSAKPKQYRLDIYDHTHGLEDGSAPYLQVLLDKPVLPKDLPLGVYRVNVRGIDKHGLQGYSNDSMVTVSEPSQEDVLRWVRNTTQAHWTLNESKSSPLNQYVCELP